MRNPRNVAKPCFRCYWWKPNFLIRWFGMTTGVGECRVEAHNTWHTFTCPRWLSKELPPERPLAWGYRAYHDPAHPDACECYPEGRNDCPRHLDCRKGGTWQ